MINHFAMNCISLVLRKLFPEKKTVIPTLLQLSRKCLQSTTSPMLSCKSKICCTDLCPKHSLLLTSAIRDVRSKMVQRFFTLDSYHLSFLIGGNGHSRVYLCRNWNNIGTSFYTNCQECPLRIDSLVEE